MEQLMAIPTINPIDPEIASDEDFAQKYKQSILDAYKIIEGRGERSPNLFNLSAALLKPTRTGSFGESLGNATEALGVEQEKAQAEAIPIAQAKAQLAKSGYELGMEEQDRKILQQLPFQQAQSRVEASYAAGVPPASSDLRMLINASSAMTGKTNAAGRVDKLIDQRYKLNDIETKAATIQTDRMKEIQKYFSEHNRVPAWATPEEEAIFTKGEVKLPTTTVQPNTGAPIKPSESSNDISKLKNAIIGQESNGQQFDKNGNVLTSSAGAKGIGQIMPDTWNSYVKAGVIPKELKIGNPEDNKKASGLILDDIARIYGNYPDKIAAVYFAGPKAVNKDGSINFDLKDSDGTTVRQYVSSVLKRIGANPVSKFEQNNERAAIPSPAGDTQLASSGVNYDRLPGESENQRNERIKGEASSERELALTGAKETQKRYLGIPDEVNAAQDKKLLGENLVKVITGNENAFGILRQNPSLLRAFQNYLETGIKVGNFSAGMPIEESIRKGLKPEEQQAVQMVESMLNQISIDTASKMKGSVSNYEDKMVKSVYGTPSNTAQFLKYIGARQQLQGMHEENLAKGFAKYYKLHPKDTYTDYMLSDEVVKLNQEYRQAATKLAIDSSRTMGIK